MGYMTFYLLALFLLVAVEGRSFLQKFKHQDVKPERKTKLATPSHQRSLLPQLPPHTDACYILEFIADGVDACKQMEPLVKKLENELNTSVRKINISKRQDFLALFDTVGGNEGGNLPFFYNRRTAQAICGPTPYSNLLHLATANRRHLFYDMPNSDEELNDSSRKGGGFTSYIASIGKGLLKKKADSALDELMKDGQFRK